MIILDRLNKKSLLAAGMAAALMAPALASQISQVLSSPLSAVILAGQSSAGFADGPGPVAQFGSITALDLGPQGWLYVADAGNRRIRLVDWAGSVTTLAGTGEDAQRDGPAREAAFHDLRLLSVDRLGNCYVLDGDQLRLVGPDGLVSTLGTLAFPWSGTVCNLVVSPGGQVYLLHRETTPWECCQWAPYPPGYLSGILLRNQHPCPSRPGRDTGDRDRCDYSPYELRLGLVPYRGL